MKMMLKLAVLLATLLLLTGVAFARIPCYCYEVTYLGLDFPEPGGSKFVELCFDDSDNIGTFAGICGEDGNLIMFFDRHPLQALAVGTASLSYLKFHEWVALFNGIENCAGYRYYIHGRITDFNNCTPG